MPTEWVMYVGPALHSECVPPARIGLDDDVAEALDESDPDAWAFLIATLQALGIDAEE